MFFFVFFACCDIFIVLTNFIPHMADVFGIDCLISLSNKPEIKALKKEKYSTFK